MSARYSATSSISAPTTENDADEILSIYRAFAALWNGQDSLTYRASEGNFYSLPYLHELTGACALILLEVGRNLETQEYSEALLYEEYLTAPEQRGGRPLEATETAKDVSALYDAIISRLEAIAWGSDRCKALGVWVDQNPDRGTQVLTALREMIRYMRDDTRRNNRG